ncbi:MAG: M56 family metallopeptidase [Terracidiphilus sp.]|jgi:hypothetical protein
MMSLLVEAAIRSIGVAFIVGMGLRVFRVRNVLAQKAAWSLVLAAALVMPIAQTLPKSWRGPVSMTVHLPAAVWRQGVPAASQTATLQSRAAAQQFQVEPAVAGGNHFPAPVVSDTELNPGAQAAEPRVAAEAAPDALRLAGLWGALRQVRPLAFAWALYCAVSLALLLRLCWGLILVTRIWLGAKQVELDSGLGFDFGFAVRSSTAVSSPVTVGSGVLLPSDFEQWDVEKLRIVLAHEESHIRHADFYLQVVAGVYGALFWFSPLGWWLKRKLSELGEAISDLAGLEEAASRISYAQLLVEFAALPRPTLIGVAMARTSNLSLRIDRLLDDSVFRQAFAGKRRLLLAVLLVPVALFAATTILRVEAAESAQQTLAIGGSQSQAPSAGVSNPDRAPDAAAPQAPASAPDATQTPLPPPAPNVPGSTVIPAGAPDTPPPPAAPDSDDTVIVGNGQTMTITRDNAVTNTNNVSTGQGTSVGHGYAYSYTSGGDSWALVTDPSDHVTFSGEWHDSTREEINKIRKLAKGKFLYFAHDGKSYFIDDPNVVAGIETMYIPMKTLGALQEALGLQQEALGKQQEELGRKHEQMTVTVPDLSKEIAALNAAAARLQAKVGSTVDQEELAGVEAKAAEMQAKLGALQGELGAREGKLGELQGKLGEQQGKLGEEQGRLGEKQGRLAAEAERKVREIIRESLRDGKARPVE